MLVTSIFSFSQSVFKSLLLQGRENQVLFGLVVLGFNATLTAKVILWRLVMHIVFPGFLTPVRTQLFFPKPPTTFPTCFCRGERRKYVRKKVHLNWGSNSQPQGHELLFGEWLRVPLIVKFSLHNSTNICD